MNRTELTGKAFGRWLVLAYAGTRTTPGGSRKAYWKCLCDCGATDDVRTEHLVSGRSRSCGCLKRELAAKQSQVHGGRNTALYDVWVQMIQRCTNPRNRSYRRYGGRGISVCARWLEFNAFQQDNAELYASGLTIDRVNNDGNYEPGNVRWVSNKENSRNTSKAIRVEWQGQQMPLNELAERYGIKINTLYARVRVRSMPIAVALGKPGIA